MCRGKIEEMVALAEQSVYTEYDLEKMDIWEIILRAAHEFSPEGDWETFDAVAAGLLRRLVENGESKR